MASSSRVTRSSSSRLRSGRPTGRNKDEQAVKVQLQPVNNEEVGEDVSTDESDDEEVGEGDVVARVNPVSKMTDYISTPYTVTKDEVCRRLDEPEKYSLTNLTSYMRLRRGTDIKTKLQKKGIILDTKNRCQMTQSPYLRLTEGECVDLAQGIMEVDTKYFPVEATSREVANYTKPMGPLADHMGPAEDRRSLIVKAR